jgi:hypothetical protein
MVRDETKNDVYMVLPFIEYDLDHAINAINTPFNTAQLRHLMNQLLLTVCYLHSAHIVHRYTHQPAFQVLRQHVKRVLQMSHSIPRLAFEHAQGHSTDVHHDQSRGQRPHLAHFAGQGAKSAQQALWYRPLQLRERLTMSPRAATNAASVLQTSCRLRPTWAIAPRRSS